jgi:hypothetical protein
MQDARNNKQNSLPFLLVALTEFRTLYFMYTVHITAAAQ